MLLFVLGLQQSGGKSSLIPLYLLFRLSRFWQFPDLKREDDRMSLDQQNSNRGLSSTSQQEVSNGGTGQPILLLPASTTAVAAANDGGSDHLNNPQLVGESSWLSISKNEDSENDIVGTPSTLSSIVGKSTGVVIAPGGFPRPHGSGLGNLGNTCFMVSLEE